MKKTLLVALLLLGGYMAWGQTIAENLTDPATGNRFIITRNYKGSEINLDDSVVKKDAVFFAAGCNVTKAAGKQMPIYFIELDIIHNDNRLGCLNEKTGKAELELEDGTVIECLQISPNDCDKTTFKGAYALMKKGDKPEVTKANLEKLSTTAIKRIIVHTSEKKLLYPIVPKERAYIKGHFELIARTTADIK